MFTEYEVEYNPSLLLNHQEKYTKSCTGKAPFLWFKKYKHFP